MSAKIHLNWLTMSATLNLEAGAPFIMTAFFGGDGFLGYLYVANETIGKRARILV